MFFTAIIILISVLLYIVANRNNKITYVFSLYFLSVAMLLIISALYISKINTYVFLNDIDYKIYKRLSRADVSVFDLARYYNLCIAMYMIASLVFYIVVKGRAAVKRTVFLVLPIIGFVYINDPDVTWEMYRIICLDNGTLSRITQTFSEFLPIVDMVIMLFFFYFPVAVVYSLCRKTKLKFKERYMTTVAVCLTLLSSCLYFFMIGIVFSGINYGNVDLTKFPVSNAGVKGYIIAPMILVLILFIIIGITLYTRPFELMYFRNQKKKRKFNSILEKDMRMILHTYKNSFCSITNLAEIIEQRYEEDDIESMHKCIEMLKCLSNEQVASLNKTIMGLSGQGDKISGGEVDLRECINSVIKKAVIPNDVKVEIIDSGESHLINGDTWQLADAFNNLIDNAVTAMKKKITESIKKR